MDNKWKGATILMVLFVAIYFLVSGFSGASVSAFLLEFIGSFFLALIIFFAGIVWQESMKVQVYEDTLNNELRLLKITLINLFMRDESDWNFGTVGSNFYFDKSRSNQIFDLLTGDRGRWEKFILDYHNTFQKKNSLVGFLISFLKTMRDGLIVGEKIDNEIRTKIITPEMAAAKGSGFRSEREAVNGEMDLSFSIYRGCIAGANDTEMLFGIAPHTNEQLTITKIESERKTFKVKCTKLKLTELESKLKKRRNSLDLIIKNIDSFCSQS